MGLRITRATPRPALLFLPVALCLGLVACVTTGPQTIPRDRFDYGAAIANSERDQLLLNIVRLRYLEAPVFLEVASVINQYSLEGQVSLQGGINTGVGTGTDTLGLGGAARWADRPTITYVPLTGRQFSQNLMTPLPPEALFALVQAGWPAELIFRMTVRSINGIEDEWASPTGRRPADPRFMELLQAWDRLRTARILGVRREGAREEAKIIVYQTGGEVAGGVERDLSFVREVLELEPEAREFHLTYGLVPDGPNQIAVLTSSMLEIMVDLAWRVDVPPEHLEGMRTGATFEQAGASPLFRVHHAAERPPEAYAAVRNRGYWFFIDDGDMVSKRTFAVLQILLSLTESGETARGPVVSISN